MVSLGVIVLFAGTIGLAASQASQDGFLDHVRLFDYALHTGTSWKIDLPADDTCVEFPADAMQRGSSILTNGNCVIVHDDGGCHGHGIRFEDFTYGYDSFAYLYYADNYHRSLRRCPCNKCAAHSSGTSVVAVSDVGSGTTESSVAL